MKALVTGAAGFVGSHLSQALLKEGIAVVGVDNFDPYYSPELKRRTAEELCKCGAEFLEFDLVKGNCCELLKGVEAVFHLAAQPGNSEKVSFELYLRNNLLATQAILEAALASESLQTFVNVSTSSVYGFFATSPEDSEAKPVSPYGVTKLAAEQLVMSKQRDRGFPACSLRLFSVYGERERPDKLFPQLISCIAEERELPLFEGAERHRRSFTYVGDAVKGFISVLEHWKQAKGEIINIGSDVSITTGEAIDIVEELMGKKVRRAMLPPRPGDQRETCADISKAKRLLGYQPNTSPREGLARMVAALSGTQNSSS